MSEATHYDIAVVGGGMVGAAAACLLADSLPNIRIALLERRRPADEWPKDGFDFRVSALTRASERLLKSLGAWELMGRAHAYSQMHVWEAEGSAQIHFECADIGEPNLGHIVENRVIAAALWQRLEAYDNIDIRCPDHIESLVRCDGAMRMATASEQMLSADLVVGADGGNSRVRELCGINVASSAYGQKGVVTTVKTSVHHADTAWQRFLPSGPVAFLPLEQGYSSIVWSVAEAEAERLLAVSDDEFCRELADALEGRLGEVSLHGERAAFPLVRQHAKDYVRPGVVLVGDAAHRIHPLAGQGVNLGFLDVAALSQVLAEAHKKSRPMGDLATLRRYERWRRGDNQSVMSLMDLFHRLYAPQPLPVRLVRNVGMSLLNQADPIKNQVIRRAMGLEGDLPDRVRAPFS